MVLKYNKPKKSVYDFCNKSVSLEIMDGQKLDACIDDLVCPYKMNKDVLVQMSGTSPALEYRKICSYSLYAKIRRLKELN